MTGNQCPDGCLQVEKLMSPTEDEDDRYTLMDINSDKLAQYECFRNIEDGDWGHPNYSVMAYAVYHGHLECLKALHQMDADWHADLPIVACEGKSWDCLRYILTEMRPDYEIKHRTVRLGNFIHHYSRKSGYVNQILASPVHLIVPISEKPLPCWQPQFEINVNLDPVRNIKDILCLLPYFSWEELKDYYLGDYFT